MKTMSVSIHYDAEKVSALEMYLAHNGLTVEAALQKTLDSLFQKHVPVQVREYIDRRNGKKTIDGKQKGEPASAPRCEPGNAP